MYAIRSYYVRAVPVDTAPAPFTPDILADAARACGIAEVSAHPSWAGALAAEAGGDGRVLVAGSLYLVGSYNFV